MPIPIDRDELFARLDKDKESLRWKLDADKAELKDEMNRLTQLILAKLEPCVCEPKKPKIFIQPMKKKK